VVGADGNELAVLTEDWSPGDLTALGLSWSPDSTRVAVSLPKRGIPCLYVRSAGHASDLILGCGETPAWSPDGRRIAFKSADSLKLVDLGTSEERTLVSGGEGQWSYLRPRWSTDGKQLLYHVGPAQHDIRTFDTTTEQESLISIDQSDEYWPSWSPDGSRIAFSRVLTSSANTPRFVVADADGTGATLVGDVPEGSGMDAAWSPDGTLLLGGRPSETRADAWDIRLLDAESAGPPVQVFTLEDSYGTTSWQRLAP
jgi:TolB protein